VRPSIGKDYVLDGGDSYNCREQASVESRGLTHLESIGLGNATFVSNGWAAGFSLAKPRHEKRPTLACFLFFDEPASSSSHPEPYAPKRHAPKIGCPQELGGHPIVVVVTSVQSFGSLVWGGLCELLSPRSTSFPKGHRQ